jgi:uracil-DNA glycosylase family 4
MPKKISSCPECLLSGSTEVPYRGNMNAEIVVVGESPGQQEIRDGRMFVGPSGKMLAEELKRIGIEPSEIFMLNAARCMIRKDELSSGQINSILSCCRPNVEMAIQAIKPKLIICLGAIAFQTIHKKSTLKKARNQFFWSKEFECWIVVTYHPGYILWNPSQRSTLQADFDRMKRFIDNGYKHNQDIVCKEVQSIRPILDGDCEQENGYYVTALDTEASGVAWENPNCICISYQVAKSYNEGWTVILHYECEKDQGDFNIFVQRGGTKEKPIYEEIGVKKAANFNQKVAELAELLKREDFKIYYMNAKFEKHQFYNLGITEIVNTTMDIKVAAHVLDSELYRDASLEDLVTYFTDLNTNIKGSLTDAEKADMFGLLKNDYDKFIEYSSADPCYTLHAAKNIKAELLKDEQSLNYFVRFAMPVENELLFEIERNGILVDKEKLPQVKEKITNDMATKTEEFKKLCPQAVVERHEKNFRLSRDIIIKEALFEWRDGKLRKNQKEPEHHNYGYNLEPIVWNKKSGSPGTDKSQVMKMIVEGNYKKPIKDLVNKYLEWGELNKLLTNYIKNFERKITKEGRLHASFSITFTSTGRVAAKNPALMTIPKHSKSAKYIRELFIPEPGCVIVEKDYAASEVRFVAQHSKDKTLVDILNKGADIHAVTAKRLNGLPDTYEFKDHDEKKNMRQMAKACVFGLLYLAKPPTLQRYAYQNFGQVFSRKKAQEFYDTFFKLYPGIKKWHHKDSDFLKKNGYLRHMFGRKRIAPNIFSEDDTAREQAQRTCINYMIQGPSSDNALLGGLCILRDKSVNVRISLFLHDALYFNIEKEKLEEVLPKLKYYMEQTPIKEYFGVDRVVPFTTETSISEKNLATSYEYND